ncbi:YheC/YheD family endospore coat-associated protein [Bacillus sp. Marseille-P3661]|uniref:YheC/YheD family endospore coat-associated protein n=1 Tax=Bacillus sp. Marseille-P3661 TaxID=1936234 RepID=UPI000C8651F8|nr:YheC/YheD family protein [Bacillus sp. Marseille-P3661]
MKKIFKINIYPIEENKNKNTPLIIISSELMKQTGVRIGQKVTLQCGKNHLICSIADTTSETDLILYCSKNVFESFYLPVMSTKLQLSIEKNDNAWELGPFIGIVTDQIYKEHFGSIHSFIEELQHYSYQNYIYLYVFNYINYHNHYVTGYYFDSGSSSWVHSSLPTPSVVHNRIHSRIKERADKTKNFFKTLSQHNIPYFNERFLNKWEVYEFLSRQEQLTPYLPDTRLLNGRFSLEEMLFTHSTLFLKPVHGSQGKNIFKIRNDNDNYSLDYTTFSGEIEKQYPSIISLYEAIRPRLQKQRYIVQQGLQLLTYQDRPLDFRLLCHRQPDNNWSVTSAIARVSSQAEFVSNLARGGELLKINTVLQNHFEGTTLNQIKRLLFEIATETATSIHQLSDGIYGELGIDLAIDHKGKPWIIEVNTKPSKNQDPSGFSPKIRPSAKAIIEYCSHLANWQL